jgi:hypothetical protein
MPASRKIGATAKIKLFFGVTKIPKSCLELLNVLSSATRSCGESGGNLCLFPAHRSFCAAAILARPFGTHLWARQLLIASSGCRPFAVVLQIMPYKFLRGDTVRRTGTQEPLVVGETEAGGLRYTLKDSRGIGYTIEWTPEEQLELVKRASDDETGLSAFYIS